MAAGATCCGAAREGRHPLTVRPPGPAVAGWARGDLTPRGWHTPMRWEIGVELPMRGSVLRGVAAMADAEDRGGTPCYRVFALFQRRSSLYYAAARLSSPTTTYLQTTWGVYSPCGRVVLALVDEQGRAMVTLEAKVFVEVAHEDARRPLD